MKRITRKCAISYRFLPYLSAVGIKSDLAYIVFLFLIDLFFSWAHKQLSAMFPSKDTLVLIDQKTGALVNDQGRLQLTRGVTRFLSLSYLSFLLI